MRRHLFPIRLVLLGTALAGSLFAVAFLTELGRDTNVRQALYPFLTAATKDEKIQRPDAFFVLRSSLFVLCIFETRLQ